MTERGLEINDAKDWRQGCHLFSQMTSHTLSSRIHPRGTLPIMAWKWRKMKSQNDRLRRDYFWCSIPCGGHYLALFFRFTWRQPLASLQKKEKSPKRLLTGGEWVFYFPRLKKKTLKSLQPRRHSGSQSWSVAAINVSHFEPAKRKWICAAPLDIWVVGRLRCA